MDSRPISLRLSSFLALAALAMVPWVDAGPAATSTWKPIIFSSPADNEISSNPISPSTQPLASADSRGLFQDASPLSSFNDLGPVPMPNGGRRIPKSSQDHQDWVFMTQAEIMGVSPEQLLSDQDRNAKSDQNSLNPLERLLERQNSSGKFSAKLAAGPAQSRNSWVRGNNETNSDDITSGLMDDGPDDRQSSRISGQFPNPAPGYFMSANPNTETAWSPLSGTPAPPPAPGPATHIQQQVEINQFQQLLNPGFVPVTAATTVPDNTTAFKPANPSPITDPTQLGSTQPLVNPVGAAFAPLNSGIGQPAALAPLPTATRQISIPLVTTPTWAPQPAPWLSQNPQPFAIPQRKF